MTLVGFARAVVTLSSLLGQPKQVGTIGEAVGNAAELLTPTEA